MWPPVVSQFAMMFDAVPDVTPVPNWILHYAAASVPLLFAAVVFLAKAWIKFSSLDASAKALHRRGDEQDARIAAQNTNMARLEKMIDKLDRKIVIREKVEEVVKEDSQVNYKLPPNFRGKRPRDDDDT